MDGRKTITRCDNFLGHAMLWTAILVGLLLALLAGCTDQARWSPTGHVDDGTLVPLTVSDTWEAIVLKPSQDGVKKKLDDAATAVFTTYPQFGAFYDTREKLTRLQLFGLVQTTTGHGTHVMHRYTVGWRRGGKVDANDNGPWEPAGTTVVESYE